MNREQIAITLYTLRDHCTTATAFAATLRRLYAIGYRAVQLSGVGPIPEHQLASILNDEGMTCCATHENGAALLTQTARIIDRLAALGCTYTAYPFPAGVDTGSQESVDTLIAGLNRAGEALHAHGQVLTYHNHGIEFRRIEGETILERIYRSTNPLYLQGELDTYWVQAGGESPQGWCRRLTNRLPLLHLKDYGIDSEGRGVFSEVGSGNLNWKEIIDAADTSGCRWFIIEQDSNWANNDPFESARISYHWVAQTLC